MRSRLTESDLTRIVKRIIKEGTVILPTHTFKSNTVSYEIKVNCTQDANGTGSITGGIRNGELRISGDMYKFFCK